LDEAIRLVAEGMPASEVDRLALAAGFPWEPLATLDDLGFDGWNLRRLLPLLAVGYTGRGTGLGFYNYSKSRRTNNLVAASLLWDARFRLAAGEGVRQVNPELPTEPDAVERLSLRAVNEAMDVEIQSSDDLDSVILRGTGFFKGWGGPTGYLKSRGYSPVLKAMKDLAKVHGPRFLPSPGFMRAAVVGEYMGTSYAAAG
jgi:3-hydroxyacyl-CoA dehydrogenase/enoyl-CoA hydratase/3-hydroxybutyryl-CoA epimerase